MASMPRMAAGDSQFRLQESSEDAVAICRDWRARRILRGGGVRGLAQDIFHHAAVDVGEAELAALKAVGELLVVEA